jgi:PhzF family phenazine biosynthesis protein
MGIPLYVIDAFTEKRFSGNPAAVCPLTEWLDDRTLQSIAEENNLSETAFFVREKGVFRLRWFTPKAEVSICGHATLASAYCIFEHLKHENSQIIFETQSGQLTVKKDADLLMMDFPAHKPVPVNTPEQLIHGLGSRPLEVLQSPDTYLAVYDNEGDILSIGPDFSLIEKLDMKCVIVTAKGSESDFVSRFFAPQLGILEDPVTGSAHSTLIPYWATRLNKTSLYAIQLSKRRGELYCEYLDNRVSIGGKAVTYAVGEINLV